MMSLSIFLGRFWGLYLIVIGFFYLTQGEFLRKAMVEFYKNGALVLMSGALNLIIGLLVVLTHNVWVPSWHVIITIIGYLALFKGLARLFFPSSGKKFCDAMCSKHGAMYLGIICLIFGLLLTYKGFFA